MSVEKVTYPTTRRLDRRNWYGEHVLAKSLYLHVKDEGWVAAKESSVLSITTATHDYVVIELTGRPGDDDGELFLWMEDLPKIEVYQRQIPPRALANP